VRGAVVVGGYITGLNAVRALGRHGIPVAVVAMRPDDLAPHSRYATERCELFDLSERPEALVELLDERSRCWNGWAVLADNDLALSVLSRHREHLARTYRMTVPPWELARQVLDKELTYRAAREVGVDLPRSFGPAEHAAARRADIRYPVVVKPVESQPFVARFGKKLLVARDRTQLLKALDEVEAAKCRASILDLVPGPDSLFTNYSVYIDRRGEPVAELSMRKLRKSPPFFGVCRAAEVARCDALREPSLELLRRIGWRGVANVEFKLDPRDGRHRLMEINGGRCFLMQGLARRAGVDYPMLAWREAVLGERVGASGNGWPGVWVHLLDDVYYGTLFRSVEGLGLRDYLASYRRPLTFAVWSTSDVRPFRVQLLQSLRKAAGAIRNARERAALYEGVQAMPTRPEGALRADLALARGGGDRREE